MSKKIRNILFFSICALPHESGAISTLHRDSPAIGGNDLLQICTTPIQMAHLVQGKHTIDSCVDSCFVNETVSPWGHRPAACAFHPQPTVTTADLPQSINLFVDEAPDRSPSSNES